MDLLHEDSREGFQYRKEVVTRLLLTNYDQGTRRHDPLYWADLLVLACHNRTLPPAQLAALAQEVRTSTVADFALASVVRILHCQPTLNASVLTEALLTVRGLWFTAGDTRSVFWSENHVLLWSSAAPVLCGLGWAPPRCPAGWRARTLAYLREKQAVGFYAFASGVYLPWSLVGLLNLYDLADDAEVRGLAAAGAQTLVRQLRQYSSEAGLWAVPQMRYQGPHYALSWDLVLLSGPARDLWEYFTGVWDGSARNFSLYKSTAFVLLVTELDLFGGVGGEPRLPALHEQFTIGRPAAEQRRVLAADAGGLDEWDLTALGWSLGAYVGPGTSEHTFRLLRHWQLWDNHQFSWARPWRHWSAHLITNDAGWLLREVTGSSLLHAKVVLWRHGNALLGSFQRYHPGFRGWQQRPLSAAVGRTVLWLASGRLQGSKRVLVPHHISGSDHLPLVVQSQHVALVAFRRSADVALSQRLSRTGVRLMVETATTSELQRSSVHDANDRRWLLFHEPEAAAYAAVFTPCGHELCAGSGHSGSQVWALVVGNRDLCGSFENFSQTITRGHVQWHHRGRTLTAAANVAGQSPEVRWQSQDGPLLKTTIVLSFYLAFTLAACVFLCWCRGVLYEVHPSSFCTLCARGHSYSAVDNQPVRTVCCKRCRRRCRRCLRHRTARGLLILIVWFKIAWALIFLMFLLMFFCWLISLDHRNE